MFRYCLIVLVLLHSGCSNLLFVPYKPFPLTPDGAGLVYEDQYVTTADGLRLHGWKISAENKTAGSILFFHGNGDNVSTQLPNTFWLAKEGYDLYVYDYRGYGQSQGTPDLDDTISDMERMIAHAVQQLPEDEKLIVIGHSLGGSMAIYSVAHSDHRDRIAALVTVEAFSDYHHITQEMLSKSWITWLFQWPLSYTISNTYSPLDSIAQVSPIPVCVIHSVNDEMIKMYHAESLFEAANEPKSLELIDSNHSTVFITKENRQVLFDYLKTLRK